LNSGQKKIILATVLDKSQVMFITFRSGKGKKSSAPCILKLYVPMKTENNSWAVRLYCTKDLIYLLWKKLYNILSHVCTLAGFESSLVR
jgi:hypothetical protein